MHATAQNLLGTVEFRKGDLDNAEEHFRLALRYDRWLIGAYANLAAVADERGNLPGAIQFYSKALSLDPTNASVYYALGVVLNRHDQLDAARQALARAVELDPHFNEAKKLLEELTGTQATNEP
jgi:Flp pilus assembly protein TadD